MKISLRELGVWNKKRTKGYVFQLASRIQGDGGTRRKEKTGKDGGRKKQLKFMSLVLKLRDN